jgi:3-oxoacyl-ACP reductase-like protein
MSIFGSIVSAIFGKSPTPAATAASPAGAPASSAPASAPSVPSAGSVAAAGAAVATAAAKPMTRAEVEAVIAKLASQSKEDLNWKQSIVDLMKLLNLDSSLNARKELAQELGYTGALNGSAEMNVWLHQQVMAKLAEGGGKVPDSMKKG